MAPNIQKITSNDHHLSINGTVQRVQTTNIFLIMGVYSTCCHYIHFSEDDIVILLVNNTMANKAKF